MEGIKNSREGERVRVRMMLRRLKVVERATVASRLVVEVK
jgi:hypothetical protein